MITTEEIQRRVRKQIVEGGEGSGNFGHAGVSGQLGGSAPGKERSVAKLTSVVAGLKKKRMSDTPAYYRLQRTAAALSAWVAPRGSKERQGELSTAKFYKRLEKQVTAARKERVASPYTQAGKQIKAREIAARALSKLFR